MKKLLIFIIIAFALTSCGLFGKAKYGCPSNGKNVDAGKLSVDDPKAMKAAKAAKKYKMTKDLSN